MTMTLILIYFLMVLYKLQILFGITAVIAGGAAIFLATVGHLEADLPLKYAWRAAILTFVMALLTVLCPGKSEAYMAAGYLAAKEGYEEFSQSELGKAAVEYIKLQVRQIKTNN